MTSLKRWPHMRSKSILSIPLFTNFQMQFNLQINPSWVHIERSNYSCNLNFLSKCIRGPVSKSDLEAFYSFTHKVGSFILTDHPYGSSFWGWHDISGNVYSPFPNSKSGNCVFSITEVPPNCRRRFVSRHACQFLSHELSSIRRTREPR